MKQKLDENLDKTGAAIYCEGILETVIYENVYNGVWLAHSRPFDGAVTEMETEDVFRNIARLEEEGFEIRIQRP